MPYDIPKPIAVPKDVIWPCCGFLEVGKWGTKQAGCNPNFHPFKQQSLDVHCEFCSTCGKRFDTIIDFFVHQDVAHFGVNVKVCALCRQPYITETMFNFHITEKHGGLKSFREELQKHSMSK